MKKILKLSVKKEKNTGRWSWTLPQFYFIYFGKTIVGEFIEEDLKIRLRIVKTEFINDNDPNCSWMWITLKKTFLSVEELIAWITREDVLQAIQGKYTLYTE